jgi:hypothetical protein
LYFCCALCTLYCQFFCIVLFLRLVYPILPVFLFCTFSSPCVPYIASFSVLYFFFALCTLYCQFSWIVLFLRLVYPILPVFLDYTFSSPCVPYIASFPGLYFFFALCSLYCQFSWIVLFLRLVYPMLTVSLGRLLFTLFVFVYYTRIVFLFCFSSSCVLYVGRCK